MHPSPRRGGSVMLNYTRDEIERAAESIDRPDPLTSTKRLLKSLRISRRLLLTDWLTMYDAAREEEDDDA